MELLPIEKDKLIDIVTEKIKDEILNGNYMPGDKLPPEREFIDQLKVSRIVVREALRRLEGTGLLKVRRGAGMFVADNNAAAVHDIFSLALRIQKVDLLEILQAGLTIEPAITELAAKERSPEHIAALRANIEQSTDLITKSKVSHYNNREFHRIVAEATQNRVLRLSMDTVLHSMDMVQGPFRGSICGDDALDWHRAIFEAIEKRKPKEAAKAMRDHIIDVQERFTKALK